MTAIALIRPASDSPAAALPASPPIGDVACASLHGRSGTDRVAGIDQAIRTAVAAHRPASRPERQRCRRSGATYLDSAVGTWSSDPRTGEPALLVDRHRSARKPASCRPQQKIPALGDRLSAATFDVYPVDGEYDPLLEQALNRLPAMYQKLLRLLMSDSGPSYLEVARILELPVGSIGPMRMRALCMLRDTPELSDRARLYHR
jgi:hypothetical protein